jgi:hypothetical protein
MTNKGMRYRRTRMAIESEKYRYEYYFLNNDYNKPIIVIDGERLKFKNRKAGADYGKALWWIKLYNKYGLSHSKTAKKYLQIKENALQEIVK